MAKILVVDDEIGIRELLSEILYDEGHTVELAENAAQAREARQADRPDLVLLDIWMPDIDGVSLLKEWSSQGLLTMPVIMMSGHATIDTAVEATRIGAINFLEKPITLQRLLSAVQAGLQAGERSQRLAQQAAAPLTTTGLPPAAPAPVPAAEATAAAPAAAPGTEPAPRADSVALSGESGEAALGSIALNQPLREARDAFERIYFEHHLACENGSMTRVADKTGLERTHLYRKLKQLGIDVNRRSRPANRGN
ncbi:response regulator [Verticiella sediminum]|uniref:Response regulator n=1 Tax=Verticiella sediminum TaxID=1247510 RepID=A0A556AMM7_9BURK|nr:response regulator [Verticiella sediminum]TSH94146.1 response regulator [Verticiella sediminum]